VDGHTFRIDMDRSGASRLRYVVNKGLSLSAAVLNDKSTTLNVRQIDGVENRDEFHCGRQRGLRSRVLRA
jgi:hypothetical protein